MARKSFCFHFNCKSILGKWLGQTSLNTKIVPNINDLLIEEKVNELHINPQKLPKNAGLCYQGSCPLGEGFYIEEALALEMLVNNKNSDVVKQCIGGKELNAMISGKIDRWIIDFEEKPFEVASKYSAPFEHLLNHVKPDRLTKDEKKYPRMVHEWWKFWHARNVLYEGIKNKKLKNVLVRARVSDFHIVEFLPADIVFTEQLAVFMMESMAEFAFLQSSIHELWARRYASTLGNGMRYIPTDCFETFPIPKLSDELYQAGEAYWNARSELSIRSQIGLYDIYKIYP